MFPFSHFELQLDNHNPMYLNGIFDIQFMSGQNRHPSFEHGHYPYAGASSAYNRGLVHQEYHPQGKISKQLGI